MPKKKSVIFDTASSMYELDIDSEPENNDGDICNEAQLDSLFTFPYHLSCEQSISLKKDYVLQMSATRTQSPTIALGLSDNTCIIYSLNDNALSKVANLPGHKDPISELLFDPTNNNVLYSASVDGTVKSWDLRTPTNALNTYNGQDGVHAPILSFDVTSSGQFLCAGTELVDGDSFLLFWDARSSKLLGGYWESHTDDITQVKFHPRKPDVMATGSTDGLINVFDVGLKNEYDALQYSYNTESSVQHVGWFTDDRGKDALSCITHTNDLQLWNVNESEKLAEFKRNTVTQKIQRTSTEDCYMVNTHRNKNNDLIVVAGSNNGKGECLRTLLFKQNELIPHSNLTGNKQIVRCSWLNEDDTLITAGESGILSIWTPGDDVSRPQNKQKSKLKLTPHKIKPF